MLTTHTNMPFALPSTHKLTQSNQNNTPSSSEGIQSSTTQPSTNSNTLNISLNNQAMTLVLEKPLEDSLPANTESPMAGSPARVRRNAAVSDQAQQGKKPITLKVFIHDDLRNYDTKKLYDKHFARLEKEIKHISGRDLIITFVNTPNDWGMSNFNYKHKDFSAALNSWAAKVLEYRQRTSFSTEKSSHTKYMLLTRDNINSEAAGVARLNGNTAIAAITRARTAGHELGHMLGATHEDAESRYKNGWWQETLMRSPDLLTPLRVESFEFSDKNRANIRQYLLGIA